MLLLFPVNSEIELKFQVDFSNRSTSPMVLYLFYGTIQILFKNFKPKDTQRRLRRDESNTVTKLLW